MQAFGMGRRVRNIFAAVLAAGSIMMNSGAALAETSWAIFDVDSGVFLGEDGGNRVQPPASLAKMMTLYITFEAIRDGRLRWEDRITVSRNASIKIPTKLWVRPGDTISVREAVDGMIVVSANDAAAAIGEHLAGSEAQFGRLMTQRARKIGMKSTVFTNPSGLTDGLRQTTTARDMAMLGLALQQEFPREYKLFAQPSFVFRGKLRKGHNNLMYRYGGVDGIKTGYTDAAGYNLASSLNLNRHRLIGVVLGGKTARARDNQMATLLTRFSNGETIEAPLVAMNVPVPTPRPAVEIAMHIPEAHMPEIEQGDGGFPVPSLTGWQIQVAALPSRGAAQELLDKVGSLVRTVHTGALAQIESTSRSGRTLYRARFEGFEDQATATRACAVLKSKKQDCITIEVP